MFEKWKNILTVGLLSAFLLGFGIVGGGQARRCALHSVSAARWPRCRNCPQARYLSGKFMSGYEDYATDQFPLREQFRTLKALDGAVRVSARRTTTASIWQTAPPPSWNIP